MHVRIFCLFLIIISASLSSLADNEKALKYLELCLKKPSSKYLFDHLYDSWDDESRSLEDKLKDGIKKKNSSIYKRLLVRLYEREGRDSEALNACKQLLNQTPGESNLLFIKARLEFNEHDYGQCVKDLDLALKDKSLSDKDAVEIKKLLGSAYLRLDKEKQALAVWKKLYADNHDLDFGEDVLQLMLNEGLFEKAKIFCEDLIKECKDKFRKLELSIKLAEIYNLKGARKEALATYRKILADTGTGSWLEKEIFSRITQIYLSEDDNAGLLKFTAEFLNEFKARSAIRLRYIEMLFAGSEEEKALEAYRELIKKAPLNNDYRIAYAKMLGSARKYEEAINVYGGLAKRFPQNSELLFSKASVEIKAERKKDALADIKTYVALNGDSEYAYIRAAKLMENAQMTKEAGEFYKEFMKKFSGSVDALETYAVWLLRSGRAKEAVKLLGSDKNLPLPILLRRSKLLINYKQIPEVYAMLLGFQKDYNSEFRFNEELFACCVALKKQDEVLKLIPALLNTAKSWDELSRAASSVCYVLKKDKLMDKYLQTLEDDKNLSANNLCLKVLIMSRLQGDDKALKSLDEAIKKNPGRLVFYRQKAMLLNSAGEYSKAADVLKELLRHDNKSRAMVYKQLISLYERADRKKDAVKWAAKLKLEFPDSVISWIIFARLQEQTGKPEEAIKTLGRAVYRFPDNDELQKQLVSAYSTKGDLRGAINICWKILRQSKSTGAKLGMITRIYQLSGSSDSLKSSLKSRLKLQTRNNPKDVFPLLALAEIAKLGYNYDEYRDYILRASQVDKNSLYLLNKLAEIDEEQGSYTAAENTLKKLCEKDKTGKAKMKLADFYFRSGDDEKAMEIYRSSLRDNKDLTSLMSFAADMIVRRRPEEAIKILKEQADISDNCVLHYLLGCAYEDTDKTEAAVKEFMRVIKLSGAIKNGTNSTSPVASIITSYRPYGINFPPALQHLLSIQMMTYRVYQYQQPVYHRYSGRYSSLGGTPGVSLLLPVTGEDAKIMALCHFGRLNKKLSSKEHASLLEFLESSGIKYPELAMGVADNDFRSTADVSKLLKKYSDDLDIKLFLCVYYNNRLKQQIGNKMFNELLTELCSKKPGYSQYLFYIILQNGPSKDNKLVDTMLDQFMKSNDLNQQQVQMLVSILSNKRITLEQKRKEQIKDLIIKGAAKLYQKNKNLQPHIIFSIINSLLQNDFIKEAAVLIKTDLKASAQNKGASSNPMTLYPHYSYHGAPAGSLNFSKQMFPTSPLIKLPEIITLFIRMNYGVNQKVRTNFFKACRELDDVQVKLIAVDQLADKKIAAEIAAKTVADPKASLSQLALCAAWFNKNNEDEKACQILLKARRMVKNKDDRKELNSRLISYALLIKDKKISQKYIADAAKKLLRLNLDTAEKVSLAGVLQLSGLTKEAEELEGVLLKNASTKKQAASPSPYNSINTDIYQRAEEKLKGGETQAGLNLLAREYHRWFRQIYSSFSGRQPSAYYNPYQLTRLFELVKRYKYQDLFLKRLLPAESGITIKKCEYAWACQQLEKTKESEKLFEEILKNNPENRFASFQYAMSLVKGDYSSAAPFLKKIPLENLMLISNNIHSFFRKADNMLNFYDLLLQKLKESKNLASQEFINQSHMLDNMVNFLERQRYLQGERKQYPGVFEAASSPEKYKDKFKEFIPRQQKLYLDICDQMMRIPSTAENYFARKTMLLELLKQDTGKLFDQGLDIMRLLNKSHINFYYNFNLQIHFDGQNHILPDFDSFMIITALKNKRVPELLKTAEGNPNPESVIRQIKNLEKLASCPEKDFMPMARKFIKEEDDDNKRWEFQKQVVTIYKYRKLTCDLTDMMFKEIELYDKDMVQNQNRFAGLTAWLEATAEKKDSKLLSKILSRITDFYVKKYKKEFPNEIDVRNRFYQVFPWMITNMLQSVIRTVLDKNPSKWYFVYKDLKPLLQIQMFSDQMNAYYLFSEQINRDPVKFLKASPFLGSLEEIDFCPVRSQNNIGSLYGMTMARIKDNSKWKKQATEYFDSLKKTAAGIEIFKAIMESSPDRIFEILADPQLKLEQMPEDKQQNFCAGLAAVINEKTNLTPASKGWKIYQIYQKLTSNSNQDKVEKFYKQDINGNPYGYAQNAGKLIADVARNNPENARKIFGHVIRKLDLFVIQNPNYINYNFQENMLNMFSQNCNDLSQFEVYYACLKEVSTPSVNIINNFYNRLQNFTNDRFNKLNKGDLFSAMQNLLKEYENTFKDTSIILTYETFHVLNNMNLNQLKELVKAQGALKPSSKISPQIKLILQAHLEMKQSRKIKAETADAMWTEIKDLPQEWQVALGLKIINLRGGEKVAQYIVAHTVKMALHRNRHVSDYNIRQLAGKLALIKDDAVIKKTAPPLINYYILEMHKWDAERLKNERTGVAQVLNLSYRIGNQKIVEKILKDFKMAQYSDSYISLANLGAEKLLKDTLDKNWQTLVSIPRLNLQPEGQACAEKICKEIKDPEENYIVRTMFAACPVLVKSRNRDTYRTQDKARNALAEEFNNIKFSKKRNKIFCIQVLLSRRRSIEILSQKASASILELSCDEVFQVDNHNFARQIGKFYFACLNHENGTKAMEKINEIIKYKNSTDRQIAQKAQNALNGLAQSYQSMDLRKIKLNQVKELSKLGLSLLSNDTASWDRLLLHIAFFNFLAGEEKELIAILKNVSDDRIRVYSNNWCNYMGNLKTFCENNKLNAREKISGFLNSSSLKKLFKSKPDELEKIKKDVLKSFAEQTKQAKSMHVKPKPGKANAADR